MYTGFLNNSELSWKAKGILAYLLSKPDNWKVIISNIVNNAIDGKGSVYKGLKELNEHGYYHKTTIRDEKGIIVRRDSVVLESPNAESLDFTASYPLPKNQEMDKPYMDYQPLTIFNNNWTYTIKVDINFKNNYNKSEHKRKGLNEQNNTKI